MFLHGGSLIYLRRVKTWWCGWILSEEEFRERERETHTQTHTHTHRERERERGRERERERERFGDMVNRLLLI